MVGFKEAMLNKFKFFTISIFTFSWLFISWPKIWQNPPIPPKIQEVQALTTDSYYGTYNSVKSTMINSLNAETDNTQYAYGGKNTLVVIQNWIETAGSGTISRVEIYCQHYATTPDGNDYTLVDYSLDDWITTEVTTGQQVMPASEASFSIDITGDRSWNWTDIGNLEVRATAKASAKQNFTNDYIDILYIQVDYTPLPAVSISLNTDGSVAFDTLALEAIEDTTSSGINDIETISVDSGPADLDVKSTTFIEGGNTWALATSNGATQIKWEFSEDGSAWTTFAMINTLYTLDTNVAQGQTRNLYLRITMPTSTNSYNQYSSTVTIVASSP